MPSNDSPAFDVLSAAENDLWEWAVERAGVENAATYIRDETLKAARARQTERGESQAPKAEPMDADTERNLRERIGTLRKERDEARALLAERDTDLARARVEGAREIREAISELRHSADVIDAYSEPSPGTTNVQAKRCREVADNLARAIPLPAPKPAEVVLSDGARVTAHCLTDRMWVLRVNGDSDTDIPAKYPQMLLDALHSGADFDALKAFATTRTEGTDGR